MITQITILTAQIQHAFAGADHEGAQGHALKHLVRKTRQQHAILESARLAFVGVADHIMHLALRIAAGFPLGGGSKSSAATSAQARVLDFRQQAVGAALQCGRQRCARHKTVMQQKIPALDIVAYFEIDWRPLRQRHFFADEFADFAYALRGHPRDGKIIDQNRWPLVAHTSA